MPVISVLPSAVADQIAAGEVVERPSSVVKELVENALDAGATTLDVVIEDGGRTLIRVSDDGCGMEADDAVLALARHGTSKIRVSSDLAAISTFGFRGEALPAISSVSRLSIETSSRDGNGTRVESEGGTPANASDTARRRGTTVTVANLFYNVPARLKFLRGARSEWRAILDVMTSLALARRDIRLTLTHDGKVVFALPPASSMRERVAALWGGSYAKQLLEVDDVEGPIRVAGLIERPADVGTATRRHFLALNGRVIRDPGMVRAVEAAYKSTIPAGMRPTLFIDLTMPTDAVDVNVHPAKAEVRFLDRWGTERVVERAIRRALGTMDAAAPVGMRFAPNLRSGDWQRQPVSTEVLSTPTVDPPPLFVQYDENDAPGDSSATAATGAEQSEPSVATSVHEPVPPLLQMRRTYIMFEHEDGIVLIDQHSAHERILFEQFMHQFERGDAPSQRLLLPLTLHLSPSQLETLDANREYFERLGYDIAEFGGNTVIINAVPTPHRRFDAERCLRDTLDALTGDRLASTAGKHERLASTIACKAAIKAGEPLSQEEMRALFIALRDTTLPAHDVHGRSTIIQLSWSEVERRFGRQ